ncbi:MAG: hypothetical protein AAGC71_15720 [Pseudomonadota bacterium]
MKIRQIGLLIGLATSAAWAQNGALEEIVVTGSRISVDSYDMPAVTVTKTADFLVQNIRLINDSRSPDLRKEEIFETIENLIKRSRSLPGMALSYGDGFLEPINLDGESLQLLEDRVRVDTSYVDIYAKVALNPDRSPKKQIGDLRDFVAGVKKVGRTEILPQGDIGLTIVGPEQYRYEIIAKIAAENAKVGAAMSGNCKIAVSGLESRVEWDRTGVSELTLYIPYYMEVSDCAPN